MPEIRMIHPDGGADVVHDDAAVALMVKAGWKREDGQAVVVPDLPKPPTFHSHATPSASYEPPPLVRKRGPYKKRGRK